jgi:hypothetical protein
MGRGNIKTKKVKNYKGSFGKNKTKIKPLKKM